MYPVTGKSIFRPQLGPSDPPRHFRIPGTQKHRTRELGDEGLVWPTHQCSAPFAFPSCMLPAQYQPYVGHTLATYSVLLAMGE